MAQLDIQQARQSDPGQFPRPGLERVDPAAHISASDERADGGTGNDVRLNPDASEGPQHADMRQPRAMPLPRAMPRRNREVVLVRKALPSERLWSTVIRSSNSWQRRADAARD